MSLASEKHALQQEAGEFSEADLRHFRRVAFLAVVLASMTMLSCVVVMPIAYQYVRLKA